MKLKLQAFFHQHCVFIIYHFTNWCRVMKLNTHRHTHTDVIVIRTLTVSSFLINIIM